MGTWIDSEAGIAFGHRRLSILDLSPSGHQPMKSVSGRFVIVFNGEVYNFEDMRAELNPHPWRGHSDTEVMLQAIERWGVESAVKRFVGMFAFALWDRQERKLHLVRDRLGIKPLYYGYAGGAFVFASELKAIEQHPNFARHIDPDALALYMRHNYVPSPHCIYKGVHKLEAGCIHTYDAVTASSQVRRYWSVKQVAETGRLSPLQIGDTEAIEVVHGLLLQAVGLCMVSDVPLGAFLSGGVDSATVVSLMQAQSTRPVKTFTIGFYEEGFNEALHAKKVAEHLRTDHSEFYVSSKEALDVIPLLPTMYDEPFSDSSQVPTYLVSKLARRNVTVSLSGDGGDELFGGYNRYALISKLWNAVKPIPVSTRIVVASMLQAISPNRIDSVFRTLRMLLPKSFPHGTAGDKIHKIAELLQLNSPQSLYFRSLSHWDNPSEVVLNSTEPSTVRDCVSEIATNTDIEESMMLADLLQYLPDDVLTKVDRASMAVGLEARVPLLDHRVVEFAWKLPLRFKIRNGCSKWILREVLYKYVPRKLIERPKMGFGVPIDRWLRGPLRAWAENLLSVKSLSTPGLLNTEKVRARWLEHCSGKRNWQYLLWDVLVFQDWYFRHTSDRPEAKKDPAEEMNSSRTAAP
jgi:asparagine synthase (glutamine-hydrolysing)